MPLVGFFPSKTPPMQSKDDTKYDKFLDLDIFLHPAVNSTYENAAGVYYHPIVTRVKFIYINENK